MINYHDEEEETAEEDKNLGETDNKENGSTGLKFLANSFILWGLHFKRFLFDKGGVATPTYICRANGSACLHKRFLYLTQDFEFLHTRKMLMITQSKIKVS